MAQFKVVQSGTTYLIESLGNTSQMKNIISTLSDIDSENGKEAGKGGWEQVKEAFEKFGFTVCYDRNLALLTVALFAAIARSGNSDLKRDARIVIGRLSRSGKSLAQALLGGDGKAIYEILNCNLFKLNILKKIGISDKYIKKYLDRLKKITPWVLSSSKKYLEVISKAFEDMTGENVELDEDHTPQISPVNVIERQIDLTLLKNQKNKVRYVRIAEGVDVPDGAFQGFTKLKEVELPHGLKFIGGSTFCGCSALEKIDIPNTVTSIGYGSFNGCESLEQIVIPESVKEFESAGYAFANCKKLKKVIMNCKIKYIERSMFENCAELTEIEIPDGVTHIMREAFKGCSKLLKVTIPNSVKEIDSGAFKGCPQNMQILGNPRDEVDTDIRFQIGRSFEKIIGNKKYIELDETDTSKQSPVYVVKTEEGLWSLSEKKDEIEYVRIAEGVDVPDGAFQDFTKLKEVELPIGLKRIGVQTFSGCSALEKIDIPNTVTSIGYGSFAGCESLEQIVIPESVKEFHTSGHIFENCKKLKKVIMNCKIQRIEHLMFENCAELTEIKIPDGVTRINAEAFSGCSKLSKVTIPSSVTEIGKGAFNHCPTDMQILGNPKTEIRDKIKKQIGKA